MDQLKAKQTVCPSTARNNEDIHSRRPHTGLRLSLLMCLTISSAALTKVNQLTDVNVYFYFVNGLFLYTFIFVQVACVYIFALYAFYA